MDADHDLDLEVSGQASAPAKGAIAQQWADDLERNKNDDGTRSAHNLYALQQTLATIRPQPQSQGKNRKLKAGPPLEATLVIFGRRALIFFCLKAVGKNEKWDHFCAHAQWWSTWRRKNVQKGHLAPSNLTFLPIAIDTNGFRRMKEEGLIHKTVPQIF